MAFQEPCCITRKLPAILRKKEWYAFQTNGDITIDKFMQTCSSMVGDNHKLILEIPILDISILRVINYYFERDWTTEAYIITQENQEELISKEVSQYNSHIHYAFHKSICEGMIAFCGKENTCIIQGHLTSEISPYFHQYCAYFGNNKESIEDIINPIKSRIKIKEQLKNKK